MSHYLIINSGSSSLKFSAVSKLNLNNIISGKIDFVGNEVKVKSNISNYSDRQSPSEILLIWLTQNNITVDCIGHRVVHGGSKYQNLQKINDEVIEDLKNMTYLAPLHQPHSTAYMKEMPKIIEKLALHNEKQRSSVEQYAYFDTAFHATMSEQAKTLPIPRKFRDEGVMRYGFHGIAYESVLCSLKEHGLNYNRVVAAHLGNGSSICAIKNGSSIDTTMGFTPLDGLPMVTRSGSLDSGALMHLVNGYNLVGKELEETLYKKSGLLAISEEGDNMEDIVNSKTEKARLAVDIFIYHTRKNLFSMLPILGGADAFVFSGGVGENCSALVKEIAGPLAIFGVELSEDIKAISNEISLYSSPNSLIPVLSVRVNEEKIIAKKIHSQLANNS